MRILLTATLIVFGLAAPAFAQQQAVLTITGNGTISAPPDIATVTTAVETAAPTAAEALAENSAIMAEVFETLTAAGVAAKDIQTNQLSVQPEYRNLKRSSSSSGEVEIYQYRVRNGVSVRVRDLANLGAVLDRIVRTGINQINGIGFGHSDPAPMLAAARKAAVADAIATAELYAEASGIRLVRILSISEFGQPNLGAVMEMDMARSSAVPIAAGEAAVATSVNVVWAIEQD